MTETHELLEPCPQIPLRKRIQLKATFEEAA